MLDFCALCCSLSCVVARLILTAFFCMLPDNIVVVEIVPKCALSNYYALIWNMFSIKTDMWDVLCLKSYFLKLAGNRWLILWFVDMLDKNMQLRIFVRQWLLFLLRLLGCWCWSSFYFYFNKMPVSSMCINLLCKASEHAFRSGNLSH